MFVTCKKNCMYLYSSWLERMFIDCETIFVFALHINLPDKYHTSSTSSTFYDKHTLQDKILRFASNNGKNTSYYYADITPLK